MREGALELAAALVAVLRDIASGFATRYRSELPPFASVGSSMKREFWRLASMMKWMIGLTCLFSPLAIRAQSATAPQPEKKSLSAFYESQFKKYPVAASGVGVKASLLLQTNQKARQYKTRLTEAWVGAKEPNFAGHYVAIDQIGCGTGCVVIFIVDWNTGRISTPPRDAAFQFRKASRLIVLNPYDECTVYGPPILYEFVDGFFRKVENEIKCDGA